MLPKLKFSEDGRSEGFFLAEKAFLFRFIFGKVCIRIIVNALKV